MAELIQENWVLLASALVIGLVVACWIFAANRTAKVERSDDGQEVGAAKRNQALIDSAPSATAPATPAASPANADVVAAATASADAEAGASVAQTTAPAPAPAAPSGEGDDLSEIKGLGPKLRAQLNAMGITTFAQIAAWDDAEIDRVDAQLGRFQGRIRRDSWVEQAKLLQAGDRAAYESRFGRT